MSNDEVIIRLTNGKRPHRYIAQVLEMSPWDVVKRQHYLRKIGRLSN